ncbi:MAG TPA: CYTH domain-containing protein [Gemmatimonadaceae bacterium]|nr:CYTH domain-containing protein [Gemmatimonadaceae bacterium]
MREVELKGVVADAAGAARAARAAGAQLEFAGRLEDRRYDTAERTLAAKDHVLRLRIYRPAARQGGPPGTGTDVSSDAVRARIEFKGPTGFADGYKVREEHATDASDPDELARILDLLGYEVTREIDREIEQYVLAGATVRFERYPHMDVLAEVEGEPDAIERAIAAMGLERAGFTTARLPDFVREFEARTGERAAICDRELAGDYRYSADDA